MSASSPLREKCASKGFARPSERNLTSKYRPSGFDKGLPMRWNYGVLIPHWSALCRNHRTSCASQSPTFLIRS